MKVASMNCHFRFFTLEEFFHSAQKNGFEAVELWTGPMHYYIDYCSYEPIDKLLRLENKYKVKIIGLCPEQTNPKANNIATSDDDQKKRTKRYFKNVIDVASSIKANQVVVTSGWAFLNEDLEQARLRSAIMLRDLAEYAFTKGIPLSIEALQPRESLIATTAKELKEFIEMVNHPNLKVCLDFGAMAMAEDSIQTYFDYFGNDVIHIHFVDGDPVGHLAWPDGQRNMTADIKTLLKNNYKGYLSFEIVHSKYYSNPFEADSKSKKCFDDCYSNINC